MRITLSRLYSLTWRGADSGGEDPSESSKTLCKESMASSSVYYGIWRGVIGSVLGSGWYGCGGNPGGISKGKLIM